MAARNLWYSVGVFAPPQLREKELPSEGRKRPCRVAIVIINYRGRDDTRECLDSLSRLTYPARDVILVCQPPDDGTAAAVRAAFPEVHVIENAANNGFAGGNNTGIRAAFERGAEYVFLLNNDTVVEPGLLEPLVALAEGDERIGIVGPKMLYHSEPDIVWSAGGMIDGQARVTRLGEGEKDVREKIEAPRDVDYIVGCGLLARRALLEEIGLFDERYFLYFEETDLCARARAAGRRVVVQPAARLWHKVSRSTGGDSLLTLYYMRRNALLYLARHGTRRARLLALLDALRLAAVWTIRGKTERRRVLLRAVGDYLRGRFGRAELVFP